MTDRPILFSGPMVRAILAGTKTETRRVVKQQPAGTGLERWSFCEASTDPRREGTFGLAPVDALGLPDFSGEVARVRCPYGRPGDRLWVRETWMASAVSDAADQVLIGYRSDDADDWRTIAPIDADAWLHRWLRRNNGAWEPSIYMPRWASRLTLAVEAVRVERLHDIDDAGARAEGVADREAYRVLWCDINGAESWDSNPWVWVVGFKRVSP